MPENIIAASAETTAAIGVEKWDLYKLASGATLVAGWQHDHVMSYASLGVAKDGSLVVDYGKQLGAVIFRRSGTVAMLNAKPGLAERMKSFAYFANDAKLRTHVQYDACSDNVVNAFIAVTTGAASCTPVIEAALLGGPAPAAVVTIGCVGYSVGEAYYGWQIGVSCFVGDQETNATYTVTPEGHDGVFIAACEAGDCAQQSVDINEESIPEGSPTAEEFSGSQEGTGADGAGGVGGDEGGDTGDNGGDDTGGGDNGGGDSGGGDSGGGDSGGGDSGGGDSGGGDSGGGCARGKLSSLATEHCN